MLGKICLKKKRVEHLLLHHSCMTIEKVEKLILSILARMLKLSWHTGAKISDYYCGTCICWRQEMWGYLTAFILERMWHITELRTKSTRGEFVHVLYRQSYYLWLKVDKIIACLKGTHTILIYKRKINRLQEATFSLTLKRSTLLHLWHSGLIVNYKPQFLFWLMV